MTRRVVVASFIAFFASFCILVVELVAGRVMAPHVGSSLYTWTSIISVVLAGISLGAYLGGLIADWFPRYLTLGVLLFLAGAATLSILPATDYVAASDTFRLDATGEIPTTASLIYRIVLLTTIVFILPAIILGMISPVVVKLAVSDVQTSGNTIGRIYAFSTLGSILGTFATGFYLVEMMGVRSILTTVGVLLLYGAPFFCMLFDGCTDGRGNSSAPRFAAWVLFLLGSLWLGQAILRWHFIVSSLGEADFLRLIEVVRTWDANASQHHWTMLRDLAIVGVSFLLAGVCWVVGGSSGASEPETLPSADPLDNPFSRDRFAEAPVVDPADARRVVRYAALINFVASFCILAIELVAGRLLAPSLGVSLYSWTSIIGVVLAGISLGAYLGGKIADRSPSWSTVGLLFLMAGLATLTVPAFTDKIGDGKFLQIDADEHYGLTQFYGIDIPLMYRILAVTVIVFFLPSLTLGTISPVVVRLALSSLKHTGSTVGKIYAWSTLGSIFGSFLTGFFLVEFFGTRTVCYAVAAILLLLAPVFGGAFSTVLGTRRVLVIGCLIALAGAIGGLSFYREEIAKPFRKEWNKEQNKEVWTREAPGTEFFKESNYYAIRILNDAERFSKPIRTLRLDNLTHSYTHMKNEYHLEYGYLKIYEELVAWRKSQKPGREDFLFVGGGGYTLPRLYDALYPQSQIDVVEIDPWVTKVAREWLGIDKTRINSFNQDGRWFVMNSKKQYDFIFGDAFNDLSIPYHLTTLEFDEQLRARLKSDGILMALVIDSVKDGEFLPTYVRTLQAAFGADKVDLIVLDEGDVEEIGQETCIVVASMEKLDFSEFQRFLDGRADPDPDNLGQKYSSVSRVVPHERLQTYLTDIKKRGRQPIVLTDDYVPADNLIAKLFSDRFGFKKKLSD